MKMLLLFVSDVSGYLVPASVSSADGVGYDGEVCERRGAICMPVS